MYTFYDVASGAPTCGVLRAVLYLGKSRRSDIHITFGGQAGGAVFNNVLLSGS